MDRRSFIEAVGLGGLGALAPRSFAFAAADAGHGSAAAAARCLASGKRPNVLLVLCDDLGWGDIGYWQNGRDAANRIATPGLDAMIAEGVVCTHAYTTAPVCAPARASMLTGKHQGHCNLRDNMFDRPVATDLTIGSVMQAAGYATWHIGKWGVGGGYESNGEKRVAMACDAGFDYSYGYPGHSHGHSFYHWEPRGIDWRTDRRQSPVIENVSAAVRNDAARYGRYSALSTGAVPFERDEEGMYYRRLVADSEVKYCYDTDLFAAKIKQLVKTHLEDPSEKKKPFFCFACFTTVHGTGNSSGSSGVAEMDLGKGYTLHIPPSAAEPAGADGNGKPFGREQPYPALDSSDAAWGGGLVWEKNADGHLPFKGTRTTANKGYNPRYTDFTAYPAFQGRYATAVTRLDAAIADIRHFLKVKGLEKETLIVFTSDNGPAAEHLGRWSPETMESNGPFTGMKRWIYEGGLREPTIAVWPDMIPSGTGDARVCPTPFQFPAWMATLADAAGLPQPAHCDGVSLLPALTGTGTQLSMRVYAEYVDGGSGRGFGFERMVRDGDYVLLRNSGRNGGAPELYDVVADPGQTKNLAADPRHAARVRRMCDLLTQCRVPCSTVGAAYGAKGYCNAAPGRAAADALPIAADPAAADAGTVEVRFFAAPRTPWPWVPAFRAMTPDETFTARDPADARRRVAGRTGAFGLSVAGVIDVGKTGEVTFRAKGAGGCQLWLHEAHVLEYEAGDCAAGRSVTLTLAEGRHPYTLYLTTSTGAVGLPTLSVRRNRTGTALKPIQDPLWGRICF